MRVEQIILSGKAITLKATDALRHIPNGYQLHHLDHNMRHPLGIYNTSIQTVCDRLRRTIGIVEDTTSLARFRNREDGGWEEQLIECEDAFLDALMEHMDDCLSVLLCFFPDKDARDRNQFVRQHRAQISDYRNRIGKLVNHIKHKQGRLRIVVIASSEHEAAGYYVEGVDANGTLGPDPKIHAGGNSAFSFHRDMRYHLANLFLISECLAQAVLGIIGSQAQSPISPIDGEGQLTETVASVSRLPATVFPGEETEPWPVVCLTPATTEGERKFIIELPATSERPTELQRPLRIMASFRGDGVSRTFRPPYFEARQC